MKKIITLSAFILVGMSSISFAQTCKVINNRCFADVDGDGKDDYIVVTGSATAPGINVHFSNGLTFDAIPGIVSNPTLYAPVVGPAYFADINGDKRADYVTLQGNLQTPKIVAYLSTKEGFSNEQVVQSVSFDKGYDGFPRGFADMDGDGRLDYVTFRGAMQRPYIVAYLSTGKGFNPKSYRSASLLAPAKEGIIKAFADINGDGKADYMDSEDGLSINTYLGNTLDFNSQFIYPFKNTLSKPINPGFLDMPRGYYDLDGDHRADYVVFRGDHDKPHVYIHTSFGSLFEEEPKITREVERGLPGMPNGFADVNGDGKWDYIAFRGTQEHPKPVIYFNVGNEFIEPCSEMKISLFNDAAYNTYFLVRYEIDGVEKVYHSPVVVTGQTYSYSIPEDAYNVEVSAFCNDCYDKRRVFTDLINRADNPHQICYRVLGTQFKKYWDYKGCPSNR
jgi:hypothetical protein